MARLERAALAHYLDSSFLLAPTTAAWFKLGIDNEDLTVNLNSDISTIKNVWGQSRVTHKGYAPSMGVNPYYANPTDAIYPKLRDITLERKRGDACKTLMLEVIAEDTEATNHLAFIEEVMIDPQEYGGPDGGINISYTINNNGNRKKGYVSAASAAAGAPVFKEGEIPSGS